MIFSHCLFGACIWNIIPQASWSGERAKTIKYRFCEVMSPKQEEMEQGLPYEHFDYATARGF
jgi:hypothetical protein